MPVMCLTWTADGLYACSAPNLCGPFFVGLSRDDAGSFLQAYERSGIISEDPFISIDRQGVVVELPGFVRGEAGFPSWEHARPPYRQGWGHPSEYY